MAHYKDVDYKIIILINKHIAKFICTFIQVDQKNLSFIII